MKRGTPEHPKSLMLMGELGVCRVVAVGVLESLWHVCAQYAPDGRLSKYPSRVLAQAMGWDGDAERLFAALEASGWVDRAGDDLVVHDWPDHADDSVHKYLARRTERFWDGSMPKLTRFGDKERAQIEAAYASAEGASAQRAHGERTASARKAPLPLPIPLPIPEPRPGEEPRAGAREASSPPPPAAPPNESRVEEAKPPPSDGVGGLEIVVKGGVKPVRKAWVDAWEKRFPGVDVGDSLANAREFFSDERNAGSRVSPGKLRSRLERWLEEDASEAERDRAFGERRAAIRREHESKGPKWDDAASAPVVEVEFLAEGLNGVSPGRVWDLALVGLRERMCAGGGAGAGDFDLWLRPTRARGSRGGRLVVEAPAEAWRDWLEGRRGEIEDALAGAVAEASARGP